VDYFVRTLLPDVQSEVAKASPKLMEMFLNYSWPGNVRELENNVKRFIILGAKAS